VVVVSVPGLGDQLQAAKAGILEIGDIYTVNKRDLPGADTVAGHLEANLDLIYPGRPGINAPGQTRGHGALNANAAVHRRHGRAAEEQPYWRPPVLKLSSADGAGVEALTDAVDAFLEWQRASGREEGRRAERIQGHILRRAAGRLLAQSVPENSDASLSGLAESVKQGDMTPDQAAECLLSALFEAWQNRPKTASDVPARV
jgi:LAO/AO transport system kinase